AVVCTKDASPAPVAPVTLAAFTRRALTSPVKLVENARSLGAYYVAFVFGGPVVITSDPKIADVLLSHRFKCTRRVFGASVSGILSKDGPEHERLKKILLKVLLDPRSLKSASTILSRRLSTEAFPELDEASSHKEPLDLLPVFEEIFTDVVTFWVLGYGGDTPGHKEKMERLVEARRALADLSFVLPTGTAWLLDRVRDYVPFSEYLAFLPGAHDYLIRRNAKRKSRDVVNETVIEAKARHDAVRAGTAALGKNSVEGLLDLFFDVVVDPAADAGDASDKPKDDGALDVAEVLAMLEAVQTAGQGPLSAALPNFLYHLAHHPSVQRQLHAEVIAAKASRASDPVRPDDLRAMPLLDAALRESLRLLPPVPTSHPRVSSQNVYKLPGMWGLPKDYHVAVDLLSMQRDPAVFGDDAEEFRPARFVGAGGSGRSARLFEDVSSADPAAAVSTDESQPFGPAFLPFGKGPYACPARRPAVVLLKIAAAEVLRRYELVPAAGDKDRQPAPAVGLDGFDAAAMGGTLRMIAGNPVVVRKRK
ncbi:hypothetical protein HK405_013933, partial [Cladochytrium tenue]